MINEPKKIDKPDEGEFEPYTSMYINLLPDDGMILSHLRNNFEELKNLISSLSEEKLLYRYEVDKWTIKEILVHLIDDERIYCYRALRYARGDKTELPGFEQDDFAANSFANERSIEGILEEYRTVRESTISLFSNFDESTYKRSGIGSGNIMSVRAAVYHIAGHELHHLNFVKEYYL